MAAGRRDTSGERRPAPPPKGCWLLLTPPLLEQLLPVVLVLFEFVVTVLAAEMQLLKADPLAAALLTNFRDKFLGCSSGECPRELAVK